MHGFICANGNATIRLDLYIDGHPVLQNANFSTMNIYLNITAEHAFVIIAITVYIVQSKRIQIYTLGQWNAHMWIENVTGIWFVTVVNDLLTHYVWLDAAGWEEMRPDNVAHVCGWSTSNVDLLIIGVEVIALWGQL